MNKLDLLCQDFFTKEKMVGFGIGKLTMTRVRKLFTDDRYRLHGLTVGKLLEKFQYQHLRRSRFVGPRAIAAINVLLRSENLPEFLPPSPSYEAKIYKGYR